MFPVVPENSLRSHAVPPDRAITQFMPPLPRWLFRTLLDEGQQTPQKLPGAKGTGNFFWPVFHVLWPTFP